MEMTLQQVTKFGISSQTRLTLVLTIILTYMLIVNVVVIGTCINHLTSSQGGGRCGSTGANSA